MNDLLEQRIVVGSLELSLLRPREPETLIDEEAFADDEFMPYWAELWPSGLALAHALPERLDGVRLVDLGCGLGVPALVAAARGGVVTALDWALDAVELLLENATRNALTLDVVHGDWRTFSGSFELAIGADLLYEERNAEALLAILPRLATQVLLADPGRPHASAFFERARREWVVEEVADRVYSLANHSSRPASSAG